jgi:hypothetical protein
MAMREGFASTDTIRLGVLMAGSQNPKMLPCHENRVADTG